MVRLHSTADHPVFNRWGFLIPAIIIFPLLCSFLGASLRKANASIDQAVSAPDSRVARIERALAEAR